MKIKLTEYEKGFYNVHTETNVFLGTFELDVDGFYHFWDNKNNNGCWGSNELRAIADKLEEINKPYREELNKYFLGKEEVGIDVF